MEHKHRIIPIFVPHLGCPHKCVFCNQRKISGTQKQATAEEVQEIVESYLLTISKDADVEIAFYGGSFTGIPIEKQEELLASVQNYIKEYKIRSIRISTRPDNINESILKILKKYNVETIELGVQSMDEEVLRMSERGHTANDVINASKLIKEFGFKLGHQMMIGLPGDNIEKDIETAKQLIALKPDVVRIYPVLVIKDTELEDLYKAGSYKPLNLDNAVEISKEILKLFKINDITVIRIGLQATENINSDNDVVTGPFHPAFKELVEAQLRIDMLEYMAKSFKSITNKEAEVLVNDKEVSKTVGNRKRNIIRFERDLGLKSAKVIGSKEVKKGQIILKIDDKQVTLNEENFINKTTIN